MVDFSRLLPSQSGFMDFTNPDQGPQNNFLQQLLSGQPEIAQSVKPFQAPEPPTPAAPARAPRERRSVLDTIGRVSDVLARVGGAEALYQPTLDANTARTEQVDINAMRKQLLEQQVQSGGMGIETDIRGRMAQALGAIQGRPDAAALWPQIAQQAGIPEAQAAAIGMQLEQNPESAGMLAKALGLQPASQGSLPASIQNYAAYQKILAEQGPEAAEEFMRFAQPDMSMIKPYQREQLERDDRDFRRQIIKDRREARMAEREFDLKEEKALSGGADLTPTQRGLITQKLGTLPVIKQQLNRLRTLQTRMEEEGTLARGAIGGLLPGAISGGTAEQFDKALGALRKSILALTRVPGIGAMSNYETALDEMALPSRWGSDEGRREALTGIDQLVTGLEAGYREMVPQRKKRQSSSSSSRKITPRTQRGGKKPSAGWSVIGVQ